MLVDPGNGGRDEFTPMEPEPACSLILEGGRRRRSPFMGFCPCWIKERHISSEKLFRSTDTIYCHWFCLSFKRIIVTFRLKDYTDESYSQLYVDSKRLLVYQKHILELSIGFVELLPFLPNTYYFGISNLILYLISPSILITILLFLT